MSSPRSRFSEHPLVRLPLAVFRILDGLLVLLAYGGVLLAQLFLPRFDDGYLQTAVARSVGELITPVHGGMSRVLPAEITTDSLPFRAGLLLVPAVVILLGLFVFRRRRQTDGAQGTGKAMAAG